MNAIDQIFIDEIQRESYQRALTDDFSIVDLVVKESASSERDENQ